MSGVYGIYCLGTDKWYVGASQNVTQRLKAHKSELKTSPHWKCSKGFYQDAAKYGLDSFAFVLLERCDTCLLKECEEKWMAKLNSIENGYNTQHSRWNILWRFSNG